MIFFRLKKIFKIVVILSLIILLFICTVNFYVKKYTERYIYKSLDEIPHCHTALILGAKVYSSGKLSTVLYDRVVRALELYKNGKVERFILSGDHGTKYYDEVNSMKKFLLNRGVSKKDIFLDHAGFNTYDSVKRAKIIFDVKDLIIITQKFHLSRSVYIARKNGLKAFGFIADRREYLYRRYYTFRESFARVKSFFEVFLNRSPKFSGSKIPITGDSGLSWD